jgi:flagellar basal-body rod protein FlgC
MDNLLSIMKISGSGMHAQGTRLKVVSENVANAQSTGSTPGSDPYRRKTVTFDEMIDRDTGASLVEVDKIGRDMSEFNLKYDPNHPAANAEGYVKMPNLNTLIEMSDMREATRSYEANLNMLDTGRRMYNQTLELLK